MLKEYFPISVLARTEKESTIPFLDDLSHHMMVVAAANLATGSSGAVLASLLHDMFKGLMVWRAGVRGSNYWLHFSTKSGIYEQLIPSSIEVDAKQVASFIQKHHDSQDNPIRSVENRQGLVTSLESKLILDQVPGKTKALVIKLSGRYRWLLAFYINQVLKQQLTDRYSNTLREILAVRNVIYHYVPANLERRYSDIDNCLEALNPGALQVYRDGDSLHITLPVLRLPRQMMIAYGEFNALEQTEDSLRVPFGEALSLMAFDGATSGKAKLLYVDAGFTITLDQSVQTFLNNELKGRPHIAYSASDIARSLEGTFRGSYRCSFCGEEANSKLPLRNTSRFTSIHVLLDPSLYVCPACAVGYELEEQLRREHTYFRIPMPALVSKIRLRPEYDELTNFIRGDNYLMSLSGEMWLQILSEVWYQRYQQRHDASYLLDPKALMLPLEVEFIPQALYPLLHAHKKKFALESSLASSLVLPASVKDIDADEFQSIRRSYQHLGVSADSLLKRIKQIYEPQGG